MKPTCIICGGMNIVEFKAHFSPFLKERMFGNVEKKTSIIKCLNCGCYYSAYRPTNEELGNLYSGYRDDCYQEQREKYEAIYTKEFNHSLGFSPENQHVRNKMMVDITDKYFNGSSIKTILDYGGDCGQYIPEKYINAKKFVYDISGVEAVVGVQKITKSKFNEIKWDLIMCCHTLEHDSEPIQIINEIKILMGVGSYLYIELPYDNNGIEEHIISGASLPIHEHINFFTTKTLSTIFNTSEFLVLENKLVSVADVSGRVCGQHICCLVKKIENNELTLLMQQIASVKNELNELKLDDNKQVVINKLKRQQKRYKKRYMIMLIINILLLIFLVYMNIYKLL